MSTATVTTKQTSLNIRSGPSTSYSIIGKLSKGQTIEIGDQVFSEGGWTWGDYNDGWVCQKDPRYSYAFLIITTTTETTVSATEVTETVEEEVNYDDLTASLLDQFNSSSSDSVSTYSSIPVDGSAVMYENKKYTASEATSTSTWSANVYSGAMDSDTLASIERRSPEYVQNSTGYPPVAGFNDVKGWYEYLYYMDYDEDNLSSDLQGLRETLNLGVEGRDELFRKYTEYYNRFKVANPNDALHKTFSHVFFVRPDCNVLERSGTTFSLPESLENDPNFYYAYYKTPELLRQLINDAGYDHDFMLYLSNKAKSFQTSDEYINYDTYGKGWTGHKIAYGKTNVESKTAGDFSITYTDDRDLHVFHIHKLWADYISNVFQGIFNPKTEYMQSRILDYVASVYYIVTAEDGETIIFWSKYYGVFPVTIPSSQYSWSAGSLISNPEFDVKYQYSFKEDYNPLSLVEFNINSGSTTYEYVPVITKDNYMSNTTWVGAPFIETFNNDDFAPYTMKLRFRKGD